METKRKWDGERLGDWIHGLLMPASSQPAVPARPAMASMRVDYKEAFHPESQVSFLALNKSRPRPTQQLEKPADKLGVYLERVSAQHQTESHTVIRRNRETACDVMTSILKTAFSLFPQFNMTFVKLPETFDDITMECVSETEFDCRLFLKKFELPESIQVLSGVQQDIPPGLALCRINEKLPAPETMHTRQQLQLVVDELNYISPSMIYPWLATGLSEAAAQVVKNHQQVFTEEASNELTVTLDFPQVLIHLPTRHGPVITVNVFPAVCGEGWPQGAQLQHSLPRQLRFSEQAQGCLTEITSRIGDGQMLWFIEARPVHLNLGVQKQARFRSGLRRIYGGVDRFWLLQFSPTLRLLMDNVTTTCTLYKYKIPVNDIRNVMLAMATYHGWSWLSPQLVDTLLLWSVKRNLDQVSTGSQLFTAYLTLLRRTLVTSSCPDFLMPNVNAALHLQHLHTPDLVAELDNVIKRLKEKPAYLLNYAGYENSDRPTSLTTLAMRTVTVLPP